MELQEEGMNNKVFSVQFLEKVRSSPCSSLQRRKRASSFEASENEYLQQGMRDSEETLIILIMKLEKKAKTREIISI